LLDLSAGGAKMVLDEPLAFQQAVTLMMESQELHLHLAVTAQVCWIRPDGRQWRLGCSFNPPLPQEDVERLLAEGILDRRHSQREPVEKPATAMWELNPQPTPVLISDLSRGGFCLRSALPAEPTSRLRLQVPGQNDEVLETTATVQWRLQVAEGYLLGCSLSHPKACALLRSALWPEAPRKRGWRSWLPF
jgi:hypothetical protein